MHINDWQNLKMLLVSLSLVILTLWTLYIRFLLSTHVISIQANPCQIESRHISMYKSKWKARMGGGIWDDQWTLTVPCKQSTFYEARGEGRMYMFSHHVPKKEWPTWNCIEVLLDNSPFKQRLSPPSAVTQNMELVVRLLKISIVRIW
jgi:hypothetical protein